MPIVMKKRKHVYQYFDSSAVRQAQAQNFALDRHQQLVNKLMDREARRRIDEMTKECKHIEKELDNICTIFPVDIKDLDRIYEGRNAKMHEVYLNIVNCYLRRQHINKRHWDDMLAAKAISEKPVRSQDHLNFVKDNFPEVARRQVDMGFLYTHHPKADIYEYGKASHDRKCLSRKVVPVGQSSGAFPANKPINIRYWKPEERSTSDIDVFFPKLAAQFAERQMHKSKAMRNRSTRSSTPSERTRSPSLFANARRVAFSAGAGQRLTTVVSEAKLMRDIACR